MPPKIDSNDARVPDYVRTLALQREDDVLARLRDVTTSLPDARMQITPAQGLFMGWLAKNLGAKQALEVGVFTGYSALCVARQLAPGGKLVACDVSKIWTDIARPFWEEAGVADRIDLRLGPASDTLASLLADGAAGTYDFAFIDADKEGYDGYYEQCLQLLRPGGVLAVDNIFMGGRAIEPPTDDAGAKAIHALTAKAFGDARVDPALVPIGDGLLLATRR